MASTYSDLKIQLMQTGENTGTWGNVTNANLTALEEAIAESVDVPFSSADVTLTLTNSNSSQSARYLRLRCTGTTGGARSLILGSGCQIEKLYLVSNGCADTITVINTTGNGIAVPAGKTMFVYNNATDVVDAVTHLTSLTLGSALPVSSGGTGSTTATFSGANITSLNANNISTGTLAVGRGGTGATTLNSEAVIIGNATSPVKFVEPGTTNNVLTSNGTAWVSQAPTGGGGGGTVQNIGTGAGTVNGISITGGPITTTGTISLGGGINVSTITTGVLPILYGGTAATTASQARDNLNLGSMATQNSGNVNITGGSISNVTLSGYAQTGASNTFTANQTINTGGAGTLFIGGSTQGIQWTGSQLQFGIISGTYMLVSSGQFLVNNDNVFKPTAGSWLGYSDQRIKENIVDYTKGLAAIKMLRPVNYNFKGELGEQTNHKTYAGLIAQEVEQTSLSNMIGEGPNGYKSLDSSELTYTLINAVKELSAQVDALKAEVATLKGA